MKKIPRNHIYISKTDLFNLLKSKLEELIFAKPIEVDFVTYDTDKNAYIVEYLFEDDAESEKKEQAKEEEDVKET